MGSTQTEQIIEIQTRRRQYQCTCEHWRARLHDKAAIEARWREHLFADYDRYLLNCVRALARSPMPIYTAAFVL